MREEIIGIDLGTTNSEVAFCVDGKIEIAAENGDPIFPSYVGIDREGKIIAGVEARNQYVLYPDRTIRSIKREMGTDKKFKLGESEYLPQEISAIILRKLKERAEKNLGRRVDRAVITVPAQFSDAQRQATRDAGSIAGLEVLRIINEPTAACLAYGRTASSQAKKILAFDLGGGTFDVSVVNIEEDIVEVISSHGDNHLGGDDMDDLIAEWIARQIYEGQTSPSLISEISRLRLKRTAETAKMHLSDFPHAMIIEDGISTESNGIESIEKELDRTGFNDMIRPLIDRMLSAVHEALADAQLKAKDIDDVVLVGGATRVPAILNTMETELGQRPRRDVHPELAVAYGAGVMAARSMGEKSHRILVDITPYTFGTSCLGMVDGEYGPHLFAPVVKAGTPLPATKAESFYTVQDCQEEVGMQIFQGENRDARKNILVGNFSIKGLSEVPSGNEVILNMRLDLDGILRATAIEKHTDLSKDIKIENALGKLTDERIAESREAISRLFGDDSFPLDGDTQGQEREIDAGDEESNGESNRESNIQRLEVKLRQVSEKVETCSDKMDDVDRTDSKQLLSRLEEALGIPDEVKFNKTLSELDDLLFYLVTE